jgi:hypothetical protein
MAVVHRVLSLLPTHHGCQCNEKAETILFCIFTTKWHSYPIEITIPMTYIGEIKNKGINLHQLDTLLGDC